MPPKRGSKRKITPQTGGSKSNGTALEAPDRDTWPGWVEMESEPAFFNVMLNEMGVNGARVQEVYSLDDEMLAILPQPVHALIFLFRYHEDDKQQQKESRCPEHVWFANQIPDFACASYALLNIINNIPGLDIGNELHKFKKFTKEMDPLARGDAVNNFEFVKRIHNSFAREIDLLQADQHARDKAAKTKKRHSTAKARAARAAAKAVKESSAEEPSASATETPARGSPRQRKTPIDTKAASETPSKKKGSKTQPNGTKKTKNGAPDDDFAGANRRDEEAEQSNIRRSTRTPKPRKDVIIDEDDTDDDKKTPHESEANDTYDEEGFHFIAYMPIEGHVWKLDGLNRNPEDMGSFAEFASWMHIAQPALLNRMAQYEGADIEFNLMAVVEDPVIADKKALAKNAKTIQAFNDRLDAFYDDWREIDDTKTSPEVVVYHSLDLSISQVEVDNERASATATEGLDREEDIAKMIQQRREVINKQGHLRAAVRDGLESVKADEEQARHRRHDYRTFVRGWLGALAENEALSAVIDD